MPSVIRNMRGNKILLAGWLSAAVFCILQIIYGQNGILATAELRDYQKKLDNRLTTLIEDNRRLMNRYRALQESPEAIRLEARDLGYFASDDRPVSVLSGPEFQLPRREEDLSIIRFERNSDSLDGFFRAAWFLLFMIFYVLLFLFEKILFRTPSWKKTVSNKISAQLPALSPPRRD